MKLFFNRSLKRDAPRTFEELGHWREAGILDLRESTSLDEILAGILSATRRHILSGRRKRRENG